MTWRFWALYLPALAILFGLGKLTEYLFEHGRSAWRRWRCHREMRRMQQQLSAHWDAQIREGAATRLAMFREIGRAAAPTTTRQSLDGAATAQDKASRKIH